MKRILPFMFAALVVLANKQAIGQACPIICPEKIEVCKTGTIPGWWKFKVGYINPTNGTKSIEVWEENGSYDTVFNITGHKDEHLYMTSLPFHSNANPPKLHWKTYTGTMGSGTNCGGDILPIFFNALSVEKGEHGAIVKCAISVENFKGPLMVQRSDNGRDFYDIGEIKVNDQQANYSFTDVTPAKKTVYYRLSGEGKFSKIVSLNYATVKITYAVNGKTVYLYNLPAGAKVEVVSMSSQVVYKTNAGTGNVTLLLDIASPGMYVVTVTPLDGGVPYKQKVQLQ